ncbi:hypothetical protein [Candidatus Palauibacter sp.]|uniref:hypothetical protein n=1 Tax=Candidatus Palauibacter sp. TaxID=3101350 RepID=UPI003C6F94D4
MRRTTSRSAPPWTRRARVAITDDGRELTVLYGQAYETGAPLTQMGFQRGLRRSATGATTS